MSLSSMLDGLVDDTPSDDLYCPDSLASFLSAIPGEIQSDNPAIINFAEGEFIYGYQYRYEVVSAVFKWIIENLRWRSPSNDSAHFDALGVFSDTLDPSHFNRYRTDCRGFSRLSIAFLRALGIPARFVSGTTFSALYEVPMASGGVVGLSFGHGAHAWVEVYYPKAGWVPYDPQECLHHTDVLRYKKSHGSQNTDTHPELYLFLVRTPDPLDWCAMEASNNDWSTLDCYSANICSIDSLEFVSIDQSYPTVKLAVADDANAIDSACCVVPGDINDDGKCNVGDAVFLITYIFRGGPAPSCWTAADTNHDCKVNIGDAVYLVNYLMRQGPPPDCTPCKSYQKSGQDIALQ
jgi:hypothetical protein